MKLKMKRREQKTYQQFKVITFKLISFALFSSQ